MEEFRLVSSRAATVQKHYQDHLDEVNMIKDDTPIDLPYGKLVCKFEDCGTILIQENAKDQLFCFMHQRKVTGILYAGKIHPDYDKYKELVRIHRRTLMKKGHRFNHYEGE